MVDSKRSLIDSRSGFCKSNSTFYSKRPPLNLPTNPYLDVTTFISSLPHRGTTAYIDAATGNRLSFTDLWISVDRVADCLYHDIGIRKGDVVLILSQNSIYFPVVCLSVMSLGAVVTTVNTLNTAAEIAKQIVDSNPCLVFTTSQLASKLVAASGAISVVITDEVEECMESFQGLNAHRVVGILSEMMKKEPREKRVRDKVNQDDTAVMLYSSGTTGPSKGVISSHGNLIAHVARLVARFQLKKEEVLLCTIPMFHAFGLLGFAMGSIAAGFTVVILKKFRLYDMMEAVEKYRVTSLTLAPPSIVAMINGKDLIKAKYDLSSLTTVGCGGAPLSKSISNASISK